MTVLKPLIYFSLFDHPLTEDEVFKYSEVQNKDQLREDIDALIKKGIIKRDGDFLLFEKDHQHTLRRVMGNKEAEAIMPRAEKTARFISKFPFIKGVAISGSLSKGYFDAESDFDFFVITKAKRVWITRTLIALYKRLFLSNSHKEFCVNYYVSTETLEIEEKNRFTATEIVTVIPVYGTSIFSEFYDHNKWVSEFFPNADLKNGLQGVKPKKNYFGTRCIEILLDNYLGQLINYTCMRVITKKWSKRYKSKVNSPYKSKKEISKHHPENFQEKVINRLNIKYKSCRELYDIHIPVEHV